MRVKGFLKYIFCFFLFMTNIWLVYSQTEWDEKVSQAKGLVIEQKQHVDISFDDKGELSIISRVYEETQFFDNTASLYREQSIGYSSTFSEISDIEAYSYVFTEKKKYKKIQVNDFVTTDSKSSGVFYDDQKRINFLFPALQANSKTTLTYTKKFREPRLWGYFMFSSNFPVVNSVFTVKAPLNVHLKFQEFGINEDHLSFTKERKGKHHIYTWHATELPKIQLSKGANGILHTAPHLIIHIDSYEFNGVTHKVLGDVGDLHTWYQNFLEEIEDDDNQEMKVMVDNIIEGKSTELEKVEAIYNWVQQNIKYIAIEDGLGGFKPRSSSLVFRRRYGDCKDMSNLLYNMLNHADINSNLTWIGTTAIPYTHKEVPTPMADNHMICTYKNGDRYFFLDATDQFNVMGVPSSHIQGREALVNKGGKFFELVDVPVVPYFKNVKADSVNIKIDGDKISGSGHLTYAGYKKYPVSNALLNMEIDDKKTFLSLLLKKGNNKFSLDSVTTQHVADKDRDLIIDYDFSIEDYFMRSSDEIFINPHFTRESEHDYIDLSTTNQSIYYSYKSLTSNMFSIEIPQDYMVTFLPENTMYNGDDFRFTIAYSIENDKIMVHQKVTIDTLRLETSQFDSWNKMIKKLYSAYKESIVLKKI